MKRNMSFILIIALFAVIFSCSKKDPLVDNDDLIIIPGIITPDGDGLDDTWFVKDSLNLIDKDHFLVRVFYDSSHVKIFESTKKDFIWDGTFNAIPQPIGYYSYYVYYKTWNELEHIRTGSLWLYRKPTKK